MKQLAKWLGRKGAAFVFTALLYIGVSFLRPEVADQVGMWLTGMLGVFAGSNAAVTVGMKGAKEGSAE